MHKTPLTFSLLTTTVAKKEESQIKKNGFQRGEGKRAERAFSIEEKESMSGLVNAN